MGKFKDGLNTGIKNANAGLKLNMEGLGQSIGSNMNGIATAAGGLIGGFLSNGLQSGAGDVLNTIGDIGGMIPGPWGAAIGAGAKVLGGLTNAAFGTAVNQEKLNAANQGTDYLNSFNSNASSFEDISGPLAQTNVQNAYRGGWFSGSKARRDNNELKRRRDYAEEAAYRSIDNNIENIAQEQYDDMLANYAAFGGNLNTNGADFTNGLIHINNGGTHDSNPYEGVPMGLDAEGVPNLVEEGETVFNDYVFSNRLKVPKAVRKKYKLRDGTSFADASKKLSKESEERPNDPISKRGLEAMMMDLSMEQEAMRNKKNNKKYQGNKFGDGGGTDIEHTPSGPLYTSSLPEYVFIDDASLDNELLPIKKNIGAHSIYDAVLKEQLPVYNVGNNGKGKNATALNTSLRYAPVFGQGIASITDALGWTNKPDYANANAIIEAGKYIAPSKVGYNPSGEYLKYNPFDRNYYLNQLNASSGATRRNIMNTAGGNRAQAMAGLLAADYNANMQLGNLARQAEEYNLAQRQQVKGFNRATNQANAEGFLKAAIANQEARNKANALGLEAQMKGYQMREATRQASEEAKSANLSGFLTSLGNIGRENAARNYQKFAILSGQYGPISPELMYLLDL